MKKIAYFLFSIITFTIFLNLAYGAVESVDINEVVINET
jgi:hypothetical protein